MTHHQKPSWLGPPKEMLVRFGVPSNTIEGQSAINASCNCIKWGRLTSRATQPMTGSTYASPLTSVSALEGMMPRIVMLGDLIIPIPDLEVPKLLVSSMGTIESPISINRHDIVVMPAWWVPSATMMATNDGVPHSALSL